MRTLAVAVALLVAPGACGPGGKEPNTAESLSPEEVRVLAMDFLQDALAQQMGFFVREGRFAADPEDLERPETFVETSGVAQFGQASLEVCEDDLVVVLATEAAEGSVFAVKARGLEPHRNGEAVLSHYVTDVPCDASDGPEQWPGGYATSRGGLLKGGKPADIPLE